MSAETELHELANIKDELSFQVRSQMIDRGLFVVGITTVYLLWVTQ